jgi:hypothetical protein
MSIFYEGAELFCQRPNFLVDLAEKFCQELAKLIASSFVVGFRVFIWGVVGGTDGGGGRGFGKKSRRRRREDWFCISYLFGRGLLQQSLLSCLIDIS